MRSHTCAAEGGAAGVIKADDSLEQHFNDTVGGGDWLCDQDAVEYFVKRGAAGAAAARALGLPVEPRAGRLGGGAALRRHEDQSAPGSRPTSPASTSCIRCSRLRSSTPRSSASTSTTRPTCSSTTAAAAASTAIEMRSGQMRRFDARGGDRRRRRRRAHVPVHHQRRDQDRRRHGARLSRRRAAEGHGVRPVPPDRPAEHRHPAHRGVPRRRRRAAQQGRPPLSAGLRHGPARPARPAAVEDDGARAARPREPGVLARAERKGNMLHDALGRRACCSTCATSARRRSTSACRWCASWRRATWASTRSPIRCRCVRWCTT